MGADFLVERSCADGIRVESSVRRVSAVQRAAPERYAAAHRGASVAPPAGLGIRDDVIHWEPRGALLSSLRCTGAARLFIVSHPCKDANIADSVVSHRDAAATAAGRLQLLLNKTEVYDYPGGLPPLLIHGSTLSEPYVSGAYCGALMHAHRSAYYAGEVNVTCQRTNYSASIMFTHSVRCSLASL